MIAALLECPANTRVLEDLDGLLVITSLFKSRQTSREVKLKLVEFLYFYLGAETAADAQGSTKSAGNTEVLGGRGKELLGAFRKEGEGRRDSQTIGGPVGGGRLGGAGDGGEEAQTKTPEEKQALLGRYLSNVQDLVDDMRDAHTQSDVSGLLSGSGGMSPVRA